MIWCKWNQLKCLMKRLIKVQEQVAWKPTKVNNGTRLKIGKNARAIHQRRHSTTRCHCVDCKNFTQKKKTIRLIIHCHLSKLQAVTIHQIEFNQNQIISEWCKFCKLCKWVEQVTTRPVAAMATLSRPLETKSNEKNRKKRAASPWGGPAQLPVYK